ncbi:hypothetical protein BC940DRAFT_287883 [Gongronella butleri]|nr:hypothetical protein BC940DRAFT_287883 [Gongronella butleri]
MDPSAYVYSYCVAKDDLVHPKAQTLSEKQAQLRRRHGQQLGHLEVSPIPASKRTLLVTMATATIADLMEVRRAFFAQQFIQVQATIHNIHPDFVCHHAKRVALNAQLKRLAMQCNVTFAVHIQQDPFIVIKGAQEDVDDARQWTLVAMDQILGLETDSVALARHLHNIVGGRRHYQLQSVMEETATNIYLAAPFLIGHHDTPLDEQQALVHISGDPQNVAKCKQLVKKLADQKATSALLRKETSLNPRKLDLILLHRQTRLRTILHDNGSFIHFPGIGSGASVIQVFAENKINLDRTIRLVNLLVYEVYQAAFKFSARILGAYNNGRHPNWLARAIRDASEFSGGELFYLTDQGVLEVYGSLEAVRLTYHFLRDKCLIHEPMDTTVTVELAAEHRAFIRGKKNGKMNKVMKETGTLIKFVSSYSELNCLVVLSSTEMDKAFDGLAMLVDELPEERSFFVPDIYHRRIIGVGGANIQAIMKKHGVYVKFAGTDEFNQLGGYFQNDHNVLARTPHKRKASLDALFDEIMSMISFNKDRDWTSQNVKVPLHQHRTIPAQFNDHLRELRRLYNTRVMWPARYGNDNVALVGPSSQLQVVKHLFLKFLTYAHFCALPASDALQTELANPSENLQNVLHHIGQEMHVAVVVPTYPARELTAPHAEPVNWAIVSAFKDAMVFCLLTKVPQDQLVTEDNGFAVQDCNARLNDAKIKLLSCLAPYAAPPLAQKMEKSLPLPRSGFQRRPGPNSLFAHDPSVPQGLLESFSSTLLLGTDTRRSAPGPPPMVDLSTPATAPLAPPYYHRMTDTWSTTTTTTPATTLDSNYGAPLAPHARRPSPPRSQSSHRHEKPPLTLSIPRQQPLPVGTAPQSAPVHAPANQFAMPSYNAIRKQHQHHHDIPIASPTSPTPIGVAPTRSASASNWPNQRQFDDISRVKIKKRPCLPQKVRNTVTRSPTHHPTLFFFFL